MIDLTKRRFKGTHDMIDLTKPIRMKKDQRKVTVAPLITYHVEVEPGHTKVFLPDEFERACENIPEPRKPREWWITLDAGDITGVVTKALTSALWTARDNAKVIHVIEWPEGAPLPEWPE